MSSFDRFFTMPRPLLLFALPLPKSTERAQKRSVWRFYIKSVKLPPQKQNALKGRLLSFWGVLLFLSVWIELLNGSTIFNILQSYILINRLWTLVFLSIFLSLTAYKEKNPASRIIAHFAGFYCVLYIVSIFGVNRLLFRHLQPPLYLKFHAERAFLQASELHSFGSGSLLSENTLPCAPHKEHLTNINHILFLGL